MDDREDTWVHNSVELLLLFDKRVLDSTINDSLPKNRRRRPNLREVLQDMTVLPLEDPSRFSVIYPLALTDNTGSNPRHRSLIT